jgi:hypothetical protein
MMKTRAPHAASAALAVGLFYCLAASAGPEKYAWEEVRPGEKVLFHVAATDDGQVRFHAASVDLKTEGVHVIVSPPRYIGAKTSRFAADMGADLAISGGFWTLITHKPLGLLVSAGKKWKEADDDIDYGFLAVARDGKAWISPPEEVMERLPDDMASAISGGPMIVREGQIGKVTGCGYICMKHPRAAVGLDQAGETLFMVVADGRQEGSASISLRTFAKFLIDIGVWNALNLDGGGSATLYVRDKGGVVNSPCEGKERSVMNSLVVILGTPQAPAASGVAAGPAREAGPVPVESSGDLITFTDGDFDEKGDIEYPPRVIHFAGVAGLFSALALLLAVSSVVIFIRRRRKRNGCDNHL